MTNIMICGDCGNKILTQTIVSACQQYGGVLTADGSHIIADTETPAFLVLSMNALSSADCKGLLIFGEALCQVSSDVRIENVIPIADSENKDVLRLLQKTGKAVIGCSMCGKDTITLSERDESGCLVCVRRTLHTLSGQTIDPCEIHLMVKCDIPVFPVLAAGCVLLLSGVPYENGYILA